MCMKRKQFNSGFCLRFLMMSCSIRVRRIAVSTILKRPVHSVVYSFFQISTNAIPILVRTVELVAILSTCTTAHVWMGLMARIVQLVSDCVKIISS